MAVMVTKTLLSNGSATGSAVNWPGFRGTVTGEGTWSGATAKLQRKTVNGTWIDVDATNCVLTANGTFGFELPPCEIRIAISGGPPSAMYFYAEGTDAP